MPSRNSLKEFAPENYYHVYNRGVEKRRIFLDAQDYRTFLGILKKYLTGEQTEHTANRHKFTNLSGEVELLAYCLMPNHFHLLLYQSAPDGVTKLMRRVMTGYVMYFNGKYSRVGGLFQGRYKAALINADAYLQHISRYIHLNPQDYKTWPYSSLSLYIGTKRLSWVNTEKIASLFDWDKAAYREFIRDYTDTKKELDFLKWQLADNGESM